MNVYIYRHVLCLVTQSCLTLCNPMDYSLPGFSVHGDSPGKNTEVGCHFLLQGKSYTEPQFKRTSSLGLSFLYSPTLTSIHESENESQVAQSCPTLCDPMDCSLPGSSVHGIFQARVLKWVVISFSKGSSHPED